jgi:hypothetical protein
MIIASVEAGNANGKYIFGAKNVKTKVLELAEED